VRLARREMESALAAGQVDFATDVLLPVSDAIEHQLIGSEQLQVVMRPDHPLASQEWTLDAYLSVRHVLVSGRSEGPGVEDFALSRSGHRRQVALRCQNYFAAMQVVRSTDLLLSLPASFARRISAGGDLCVRPMPVSIPPLELYLYWHSKATRDPALMWLKEQILSLPFHNTGCQGTETE